jgi:hypothetical protein
MFAVNAAGHILELQNQVIKFSHRIHGLFIPSIESKLLEMADAAVNNENQWRLLQLSRDLVRTQADLLSGFDKRLLENFSLFEEGRLGGIEKPTVDDEQPFSLMENGDLEQSLAVSTLTRRAEARFSEALFALNQRMAILKGGRKLPEGGNPLGPAVFANALQADIDQLQLDARLSVLYFRVFEIILLKNLGDLYDSANNYLIEQGILPHLRYGTGVVDIRITPGQQDKNGKVQDINASPIVLVRAAAHENIYSGIRDLQTRGAAVKPGSIAKQEESFFWNRSIEVSAGHTVSAMHSREDIMDALHRIPVFHYAEVLEQVAVPEAIPVQEYLALTWRLHEQLGGFKQISQEDGYTIDLVGMIFESMLDDKVLPDSVKAVLSYLHTPYLKIALADRTFFENPHHPAPQLLTALASVGARWVNANGESQFKVFPKIKTVVRRVLTGFQTETGVFETQLFEDLLLEMREFSQKIEHSVLLVERRVRERAEGEDRLRQVKSRVLQAVRKGIEGYELPAHTLMLLLYPWSDYLTFILLRHGDHSALWQEGVDVVSDIAWSVQAKKDINERNRLMLIQESLQTRVYVGLETIAYDQAKSNKLLELLQRSQMMALQNLDVESLSAERRMEIEKEAGASLEATTDVDSCSLSIAEKEILDTISHADFSGWIEFDFIEQQTNLRARIAWANRETLRYMLVDRTGKPVAMKNGRDIARMILASKARIVVDTGKPFFEQVLETVYARLGASLAH